MIFIKKHFIKDTNNLNCIETMIRKNQYRYGLVKKYEERAHIYHDYVMKKYSTINLNTIMNSENYTKDFQKSMNLANKFIDMRIRLSKFQDMVLRIQNETLELQNNIKRALVEKVENRDD